MEYHQGGHELALSMNTRFNAASLHFVLGDTSLLTDWFRSDGRLSAFLCVTGYGVCRNDCSTLTGVTANLLAVLKYIFGKSPFHDTGRSRLLWHDYCSGSHELIFRSPYGEFTRAANGELRYWDTGQGKALT